MPTYRWVGDGTFRDNANDRAVESGETVELREGVGEPNSELVRVEDENEGGDETSGDEGADTYTAEELGETDYDELRGIAGEFDDVKGNASADKLREELEGRERV